MALGTVKWFNPIKGYGFIQPEDGGRDVFVHISMVERAGMSSLQEGQKVSFELASERGRTSAANINEPQRTTYVRRRLREEPPSLMFGFG
jgi:CspA family cold shock protein